MKLENVLKLEKYCPRYDDSLCFTKDHDSLEGLTCQRCIHGNKLVERLLERAGQVDRVVEMAEQAIAKAEGKVQEGKMKIYVIIGQRHESYEGQYGVEAFDCADEYTHSDNPEYLDKKLEEYRNSKEFSAIDMMSIMVDEEVIKDLLFPDNQITGEIGRAQFFYRYKVDEWRNR